MDKKIILGILLIVLTLFGGVFLLQFGKNKQVEQSTQATANSSNYEVNNTSACDKDGLKSFDGKYYSFTYPCQYDIHINPSDDRIVSFGSPDYLSRLGEDGKLVANPQGYIITVSYGELESLGNSWGKNPQEQWLNWMGRPGGAIGKQEFIGVTKGEDGKDIFKTVVKGYGFMDEMKEKQVHVTIGLHNDDYKKYVEIGILTPEKDFDQNERVLNDVVKSLVIK